MEATAFASLSDGDTLTAVTGGQGLTMVILTLRTEGIDPGDPQRPFLATNPSADILLTYGTQTGAHYISHLAFTANAAGQLTSKTAAGAGLYVVLNPNALDRLLAVTARVTDKNGTQRCGTTHIRVSR